MNTEAQGIKRYSTSVKLKGLNEELIAVRFQLLWLLG